MTSGLLMQVVLREELTVVVNDKWSLHAGGHLTRFDCNTTWTMMIVIMLLTMILDTDFAR